MKKIRMQGKQAGGGNSRQLEFKSFKTFFEILFKSYASRGAELPNTRGASWE
jgi:hypothetical protein